MATIVPERKRLSFMPQAFTPRLMMRAEAMVYQQAGTLSDDYNGGSWNFYTLSNDGFYFAPATTQRFKVSVHGNGYEGEVSADAFGIIVTLFVYGALCWIGNEKLRDKFSDHYHQLRDFALSHPEASAILQAID
ncbi:antirestriction protein [Paraburkholderia sp. BL8N3]|nr:antirestriction protein [Paraburkholderia sp. BL8N3]